MKSKRQRAINKAFKRDEYKLAIKETEEGNGVNLGYNKEELDATVDSKTVAEDVAELRNLIPHVKTEEKATFTSDTSIDTANSVQSIGKKIQEEASSKTKIPFFQRLFNIKLKKNK